MTRYLVVIEQSEGTYSAYVPDLPGCVAAADTREELRSLLQDAIRMHLDALDAKGDPIPQPRASAEYVADDVE